MYKTGFYGETVDNAVRLYNFGGYPEIEVFGDEGAETQKRADNIARKLNGHDALVEACNIALLALTHEPVNHKDIKFIKQALKQAESEE